MRLIDGQMKKTGEIFTVPVRDRLFRFAATMLGNRDDAEDVVNDILERFWRRREEISKKGNPEAFALTSVRNLCIDRLRRRRETTDEIPDSEAAESSDGWSEVEMVRRAIRSLPDRQREIIHLRDIEGYTNAEIAQITGLAEDVVRVYVSRGRKALRLKIESEDNYRLPSDSAHVCPETGSPRLTFKKQDNIKV